MEDTSLSSTSTYSVDSSEQSDGDICSNPLLGSFEIFQGSEDLSTEASTTDVHQCPQEPILTMLLDLLHNFWSETLIHGGGGYVHRMAKLVREFSQMPCENLPVLFAYTRTSSDSDSHLIFSLIERYFRKTRSNKICEGLSSRSYCSPQMVFVSECQTVYDVVTTIVTALKKKKKLKRRMSCHNFSEQGWLAEFFYYVCSPPVEPIVVIMCDIENRSTIMITTLIELFYRVRASSYKPLTGVVYSSSAGVSMAPDATSPCSHAPISLVLGVSFSTFHMITERWDQNTLLKTVLATTVIFDVKETVRYAADTLVSHLFITSALEIPYAFLYSLVDDVIQLSRSFEYFQRHIECFLTVLFSLLSPSLMMLAVPVHLTVSDIHNQQDSLCLLKPHLHFLFPKNHYSRSRCPTIHISLHDPLDSPCGLHDALDQVYRRLDDVCYLSHSNAPLPIRTPPKTRSNITAPYVDEVVDTQNTLISYRILYFCLTWKRRYVLSLLRYCNLFPCPIVRFFALDRLDSNITGDNIVKLLKSFLDNVKGSLNLQDFQKRVMAFFTLNDTHFRLFLHVHMAELQEERIQARRHTSENNNSNAFTAEGQCSSSISCCTLEQEMHEWMDAVEQAEEDQISRLLTFLTHLISVSFHKVPEQGVLLPLAVYHKAWTITTHLLNPVPQSSVGAFFGQGAFPFGSQRTSEFRVPLPRTYTPTEVFQMDFFIFYGYLLPNTPRCEKASLASWFTTFTLVLHGCDTLVISTKKECEHAGRNCTKNIPLQNNRAPPSACISYQTYGKYGCLNAQCLWKRFLLVIDTLVLMGFIGYPFRTYKKARGSPQHGIPSYLKEYLNILVGIECRILYSPVEEQGFSLP